MTYFEDVPNARTVATTSFRLAERNIVDVVGIRAMTLVTGEPGAGKTHGAKRICGRLADRRMIYLEAPATANPRQLANLLLAEVTGVPHNENRFVGTDLLLVALEETPSVLVVDEAQRLSLLNLEWLRYIHFQAAGRVPLVIVGGPVARKRLQRDHQLWSRIVLPSTFQRLDTPAVSDIVRAFHGLWQDVPTKAIERYNHKLDGSFRCWTKLTWGALTLGQKPGASQLTTQELVDLAYVREFEMAGGE